MSAQASLFENPEIEARDRVLEEFERRDGEWLDGIRLVALYLYKTKGRAISADDLREVIAKHPEMEPPGSMKVMGQVFRRGWRAVGRIQSKTPGSHANEIRTYVPVLD